MKRILDMFIYWDQNIKKPLIHVYKPLSEILQFKLTAYICCHFWCIGNSVPFYFGIGFSKVTSGKKNQNNFLFILVYILAYLE